MEEVFDHLEQAKSKLQEERTKLELEKEQLELEKSHLVQNITKIKSVTSLSQTGDSDFPSIIKLDVGGTLFKTLLSTLREGDHMFSRMFSGRFPLERDENGAYFIDRDPLVFGYVLNVLRGVEVPYQFLSEKESWFLQNDLEYFGIVEPGVSRWGRCVGGIIEGDVFRKTDVAGWNCGVLSSNDIRDGENEITIRFDDGSTAYVMVGVAVESIVLSTSSYGSSGWFLYLSTGGLYSTGPQNFINSHRIQEISVGSTISMRYADGTLTYTINGGSVTTPYRGIPQTQSLHFCLLVSDPNAIFTII